MARARNINAARPELVLKMIDSGTPYVCAHPGCHVTHDLTVDHKTPISRGGGDDIENLQFMCGPHNSKKGDRV